MVLDDMMFLDCNADAWKDKGFQDENAGIQGDIGFFLGDGRIWKNN